jgi:hypothetical protein
VIVSENGPQCTVYAVVVECVVGKPALHGRLCTESAEEWMCFRFRTRESAVTDVA